VSRWGTAPKVVVVVVVFFWGGGGQGVTLIGSPYFFLKHWALSLEVIPFGPPL